MPEYGTKHEQTRKVPLGFFDDDKRFRRSNADRGHVYFMQAGEGGPVKIGSTLQDPERRKAELQTGCPYELHVVRLYAGIGREDYFHRLYKRFHIRGEWYDARCLGFTPMRGLAA